MFEKLPSSSTELRNAMLHLCIGNLKLVTMMDNFDKERFGFDGVDRSGIFDVSERVHWLNWFLENHAALFETYCALANEKSKRLYLNIIAFRIAGHHSLRIETSFEEKGADYETFLRLQGGRPSTLALSGMFGGLTHYDFSFEGKRYTIDCLGLKFYLFRRQYFYREGGVAIGPAEGDRVIDAGACLGDSTIVFGKAVGPTGKVFAFDPVADHLEILRHNVEQNGDCDIVAFPFGLSDKDVDGPPIRVGKYSPGFHAGDAHVPVRALDGLALKGAVPKFEFIKMDIEGSELAALKGASGCIREFRPKLAISLYHKENDIFEIPAYILATFPFYRLFIGHYTIHNEETVLYCLPSA